MRSRPRIVVTGGAGFIGANLCRALVADEVGDVTVLDDFSTGRRENLDGLPLEIVPGSVLDESLVAEVCSPSTVIVHLAARPSVARSLEDPLATHAVNVTGTMLVLETARQAGARVVLASSSSVYGANPALPKRESDVARPLSPYAASKLAAESYALAFAASFDLPVLAFRFFNVFGQLQAADHAYAAVIPAFVSAALRDRPIVVHGDGTQTRDFTYVASVVRVLREAIIAGVTHPEPVNLAFGTRISVLDLIAALEHELGQPLTAEHTAPRVGDVHHSQADVTTLRRLFPTIQAVPFRVGLRETIDWFRSAQPRSDQRADRDARKAGAAT